MSRDTHEVDTTMRDWSRGIGERHGRRDRDASLQARTLVDLERERHTACLHRWPAIVASMRTLVASYNEGAGTGTLTLTEDAVNHGVTLESARNGRSALVLVLDGAEVSVRTGNGHAGQVNETHWVSLNRTDEDAAAYLLRNWMEQL
jgi:hypothetical protein